MPLALVLAFASSHRKKDREKLFHYIVGYFENFNHVTSKRLYFRVGKKVNRYDDIRYTTGQAFDSFC